MPGWPSLTAPRSSTTGRPAKKPGEFLIQLSSWASHSMMGACGARTKAMYERMQKRIELFASLALVTAAPSIFCGGDCCEHWAWNG